VNLIKFYTYLQI